MTGHAWTPDPNQPRYATCDTCGTRAHHTLALALLIGGCAT